MPAQTAPAPAPDKSGNLPVNGVNYYYEIRGEGEPLLLLHGGLGSIDMFGPVLPMLVGEPPGDRRRSARPWPHRRSATGRSTSIDIGDDLAAILTTARLRRGRRAWLFLRRGGGLPARRAAPEAGAPARARFRAVLRKTASIPRCCRMQAQVGAAMADQMKDTPMYKSYVAVAPNPEDFPKLLDRMGELMRKPYDWREDVEELKMPVMLVFGDSDMFRPEHIVEVLSAARRRAEGCRLAAREHVAEPAGDPAEPHPLRDVFGAGDGDDGDAVSEWRDGWP